jgi:hypothetical protein
MNKCIECNKEFNEEDLSGYCYECCEKVYLICEKCGIKTQYVRFEGLTECNICDSCLFKEEMKGGVE